MSKLAKKSELLTQLRKNPIVQVACQRTGIGRATYYRWRHASSEFSELADEAIYVGEQLISDMAESQLMNAIKNGNMSAIVFWLKHHHKTYETRVRVDANIKHENPELTPEQEALVTKALAMAGILSSPKETTHGNIK
jgi:glutamate/tyrosine decarboxylase-like PLP-dependent enzyme